MTPAQFVARKPEFQKASSALIQSALDDATARINEGELGTSYPEALAQLAAHILSLSPFGRTLRSEGDDGDKYLREFERICDECIPRMFVL